MEKYEEIIKFYLMTAKLKYKLRSGWDNKHWDIQSDRIESIAEHVYGCMMLAIAMDSEFDFSIDVNRVVKMLALHEIGEAIIGDITPYDGITPEDKIRMEEEAIEEVLGNLVKKDELYNLLIEFDRHDTNDSRFAYLIDKFEAVLQSKYYQDNGMHKSLDDQEGNVCFESDILQEYVKNGASTPFELWYLSNKETFKDNSIFNELFEYIKVLDISKKTV